MEHGTDTTEEIQKSIGRLFFLLLLMFFVATFVLWRIDNPRAEYLRARAFDVLIAPLEGGLVPIHNVVEMAKGFKSYQQLYEQNQQLKRDLKEQQIWSEAASQLAQQNAKLIVLNNVQVDPKLSHITGVVLVDSGSPFRKSVRVNVGRQDGIKDGWAAMDGLGLVGRISGVGKRTARILLLTDTASNVPILLQETGQRGFLSGDNSSRPTLEFLENPEQVRPGDKVVSSGDGGVFPAGLPIGQVVVGNDRRLRVILSADYQNIELLRILRSSAPEEITSYGELVAPHHESNAGGGNNE